VHAPADWDKSPALYCGRGGREQPAGSHTISWRDSNYLARQLATYTPWRGVLQCWLVGYELDKTVELWTEGDESPC
jgi:hypothetical protein